MHVRIGLTWIGIATLGLVVGFGCSSSDNGASSRPASSSADGGAAGDAGSPAAIGAAARAGARTHDDENDVAGAGGACAGDYACPSVLYGWHASIAVDLPLSVADAAEATFTACRNSQCYVAKGNAQTDARPGSPWVVDDANEVSLFLTLDGSGATPFAVLSWGFFPDSAVIVSDHYSLSVQPSGAAPTTLFDQQVTYETEVADPTLVSEGYCRHCSEIEAAHVDTRASK